MSSEIFSKSVKYLDGSDMGTLGTILSGIKATLFVDNGLLIHNQSFLSNLNYYDFNIFRWKSLLFDHFFLIGSEASLIAQYVSMVGSLWRWLSLGWSGGCCSRPNGVSTCARLALTRAPRAMQV